MARTLVPMALLFGVIVAALVFVVAEEMNALAAVRAYVRGEGLLVLVGIGTLVAWVLVRHMHRAEAQNERLIAELQRTNSVRAEFVATISHELRTPLNVVIGYADVLLDAASGDLTPEQTAIVRRIRRGAYELFELISATLDLSRLEAGRVEVTGRAIAVADLVREVAEEVRALDDTPGVRLEWRVDPDLPVIVTDPLKLKVVLKNLVRNAVKFTPAGSVAVAASRQRGGVELCVADTGIGIAPDEQAVIFEPFRQLAPPGTGASGGLGLGLYIVRRLLTLLGGTIIVESAVGKGSTFRVWLPAALPGEAAEAA